MTEKGETDSEEEIDPNEGPISPTVGFRKCPICVRGFHWECLGAELVDPKDPTRGHFLCNCGCEAA